MINEREYSETVKSMRNRTKRLEREGDYWTQEEREKLVRMFGNGEGITDIAIQLQRTEPAVFQQIEKLDLYQRKENPIRHRNDPKPPSCLCDACQADETACPRCTSCVNAQEAV